MGQVTPNISIYIPAAGETNYDASFAAGMINIDQHDHSGPPTKGVPIANAGIADGSITYNKLNANVVTVGGGLAVSGATPNSLQVAGILTSLFNIPAGGILVATSTTTAINRTITGTPGQIVIANGNGVAGNPTISIDPTFLPTSTSVVRQVFTFTGASQTYTPTAGMTNCDVEIVAAGGNGNSASGLSSGGGAGGYSKKIFTSAAIGASQTITLSATGTASTFGTSPILICQSGASGNTAGSKGGAGGTASGGDINITGGDGAPSVSPVGGTGGSSYFGGGGSGGASSNGNNGNAFGSGGGGASTGAFTSGNGAPSYCVITEYIN